MCPVVSRIGTSTHVLPDIVASLTLVSVEGTTSVPVSDEWQESLSSETAAELESRFWPLKIADAPLATFIVPIRPAWAAALFDVELSKQTLLRRPMALGISREHVYYRSPRPKTVFAPARILSYVSGAGRMREGGAVRACSQLLEVRVGPDREIFAQFQHLGVYGLADVRGASHDGRVMAMRFGQTERFQQPLPLERLRELAKDHGVAPFLQGPWRISGELFTAIYRGGFPNDR